MGGDPTTDATLEVHDLHVRFIVDGGGRFEAVKGIDLRLRSGQTVALVGESGSGKSASARAILRILRDDEAEVSGEVRYNGKNLLDIDEPAMRKIRGNDIAMIFQNPRDVLHPMITVEAQIRAVMQAHREMDRSTARARALELLTKVGIPNPEARLGAYPHQLSGGMCQRVMIAMALACNPRFLLADEPTTALDVTIQAQVFDELDSLRDEMNLGVLLITHDFGLVARSADFVYVMKGGEIVESGSTDAVFSAPSHAYTRQLMEAVPRFSVAPTYSYADLSEAVEA